MEEFKCLICGKPMRKTEDYAECTYCGKTEKADYICVESHYICEECRLAKPEEIVRKTCMSTKMLDPLKVAVLIMKHPAIPIHGPEHHYIVSCSILASLRNLGVFNIDGFTFGRAISRAKRIVYGSCGLLGVCGAAAGVGIAVSIALNANMMSDKERSLAMKATSEALDAIQRLGGPRCCKLSTYTAIITAVRFFKIELGISIPMNENLTPCWFRFRNSECLKEKCPYYV